MKFLILLFYCFWLTNLFSGRLAARAIRAWMDKVLILIYGITWVKQDCHKLNTLWNLPSPFSRLYKCELFYAAIRSDWQFCTENSATLPNKYVKLEKNSKILPLFPVFRANIKTLRRFWNILHRFESPRLQILRILPHPPSLLIQVTGLTCILIIFQVYVAYRRCRYLQHGFSSLETSSSDSQVFWKHQFALINPDKFINTNRFTCLYDKITMTKSLWQQFFDKSFGFLGFLDLIHLPRSVFWTNIKWKAFRTLI